MQIMQIAQIWIVATSLILMWDQNRLQISHKTSCYLNVLGFLLSKQRRNHYNIEMDQILIRGFQYLALMWLRKMTRV